MAGLNSREIEGEVGLPASIAPAAPLRLPLHAALPLPPSPPGQNPLLALSPAHPAHRPDRRPTSSLNALPSGSGSAHPAPVRQGGRACACACA